MAALAACGGGGGGTLPANYLVGEWGITALEGALGPVDSTNSVWSFRADGTYDWFFLFPGAFNVAGSGTYVFVPETRSIELTGIIPQTVLVGASDPNHLPLTSSSATCFTFDDDEGDQWKYCRLPDPESLSAVLSRLPREDGIFHGPGELTVDFRLGVREELKALRWWGGYGNNGVPASDRFHVRFYEADETGMPGIQPVAEYLFVEPSRQLTALRSHASPDVFQFEAVLPQPFLTRAGTTYFVSLERSSPIPAYGWYDSKREGKFWVRILDGWFQSVVAELAIELLATPRQGGSALVFDGVDDSVDFGFVRPLGPHTVEAWIKPENDARSQVVVGHVAGPGQASSSGPFLGIAQQGEAFSMIYGLEPAGSGNGTALFGPRVVTGEWVHLAGTFDGRVAKLYVDGVLAQEVEGARSDASDYLSAGAVVFHNGTQAHFEGALDEVRLWNRALTAEEIRDTMGRKLRGTEPDLAGYWDFDEGSGQLVEDRTENGTAGVLGSTFGPDPRDPSWAESDAPVAR